MELRSGDIFVTKNPMWLGRAINKVQKIGSIDNNSEYSHAGIIIGPGGGTFESLWSIRTSHINRYSGKKVLIGRVTGMTPAIFKKGFDNVFDEHAGQTYPFWRLVFHLFRPIAKYISSGKFVVCLELAAKFLYKCGLWEYWKGINPDDIADRIIHWKSIGIVYDGIWNVRKRQE